jgi:hypothetical protein
VATTFLFADGGTGHSCDLGSAPAIGEVDVLCINSDTIITAVASSAGAAWVLAESAVANQGSYIYYRKATGSEPQTVVVTTSGNFNTHVSWSRWPSLNALDTSTNTQANGAAGNITPVHSTGVMAEATELVIAFGAMHAIGVADQNTPVWSTGFNPLTEGIQNAGGAGGGVLGYVGYKQNAGTAAEAPRVSWSGANTNDRYMLTVSFTTSNLVNVTGVGVAAGTGVANAATVAVSPSAGVSAGTGVAESATVSIAPEIGVASGVGAALQPSIETEGEVHLYTFGPCEPWDPIWPQGDCALILETASAEVTGWAIQAASEVLYQLTAQRFSLCQVTLRPCRKSCYGNFPWYMWWEYGTYPQPYWWNGTWYNLACNNCPGDSCSCPGLDETMLPGPVSSVTEVKVDGVVLTSGVDYRVDDYRKLVRLGSDPWPFCQNMNLADTEVGTWAVTAVYGEAVPIMGRMAVGELALELVKYIMCADDCAIPRGTVDISRQGVSMTIANMADLFNTGFIQLRMCDMFIKISNPNHRQSRSAVYDLDSPQNRAWGTAGL